jgi:hypothetical protein
MPPTGQCLLSGGQSGSGKTYALGTILEQLLLHTSLRVIVLDPNSDFVRLREAREGVDEDVAARYRNAAEGVVVRTVGSGPERLHVRFRDFDPVEQAAVLRLDPIKNREEYGALKKRVLQGGSDLQLLRWCFRNGRKPGKEEIEIWNTFMKKRGWKDSSSAGLERDKRAAGLADRSEIETWFDLFDADEGRKAV